MKRQTHTTSAQPAFAVIRGFLGAQDNIAILTDAAWLFASTILWNHFIFSGAEKENCKTLIRVELSGAVSTAKAFTRFCESILLAKISGNGQIVHLPSEWLAGDEKRMAVALLENVNLTRRSMPGYQQAVRALAEAALEICQEPTKQNFCYWRSYFIERQEPVLLDLFTLYCANLHYLNN